MNNQKGFLPIIILIIIVLLGGGILAWQYLGAPKEIEEEYEEPLTLQYFRSDLVQSIDTKFNIELPELIIQEIIEDLKKEYPAITANVLREDSFSVAKIDLNDDKIEEFIIFPAWFGHTLVRGASGNGPIYVFQKTNNIWKKIGIQQGNMVYKENKKTEGYYNLITYFHSSACSGTITRYKWQKSTLEYMVRPYIEIDFWGTPECPTDR